MDGELSGRNDAEMAARVRRDDRREADEQIGEDELVAQAPYQMLVEQTPGQWNRQAEERQTDQKLHPGKQGAASAGARRSSQISPNPSASQKTAPATPVGGRRRHLRGVRTAGTGSLCRPPD